MNTTTAKPITHEVVDIQTKQTIGRYTSGPSARRVADRKDKAYGAIRYVVKLV